MKSLWSDADAERLVERYAGERVGRDLALRVYTSRLLGGEPKLVLHGGGNTSVKTVVKDLLDEEVEVLCVKGSGWDMAEIEPAGLPAVRLAPGRLERTTVAVMTPKDLGPSWAARLKREIDAPYFNRLREFVEIEWADDIQPVDRRVVVEQRAKLDFRGAQIDQGGLRVGFKLNALQLQAIEVDAGDVPHLQALAADIEHAIVISEALLCHRQHGLLLQHLHEGRA